LFINDTVELPEELKEERLNAFSTGKIRVLVTKSRLGGWGLNWQHCSFMTFFPSFSYEAFYQSIRRCWRFGQMNEVICNIVTSEAESAVMDNMRRKERQADEMYSGIVREMKNYQQNEKIKSIGNREIEIPSWLDEKQ